MKDGVHAMLVAPGAACAGIIFLGLASGSVFITVVGTLFIRGAFLISVTAFVLFLREWILMKGS